MAEDTISVINPLIQKRKATLSDTIQISGFFLHSEVLEVFTLEYLEIRVSLDMKGHFLRVMCQPVWATWLGPLTTPWTAYQ